MLNRVTQEKLYLHFISFMPHSLQMGGLTVDFGCLMALWAISNDHNLPVPHV